MGPLEHSEIGLKNLGSRESYLRHARYYHRCLERANDPYRGGKHQQALLELDDNWDNIERDISDGLSRMLAPTLPSLLERRDL